MKRIPTPDPKLARIALAFACMLGAAFPVHSETISVPNEPLSAATSLVLPNVMFILDDSGSMDFDYMPDFVHDVDKPATGLTAACADSADVEGSEITGSIKGAPNQCQLGDPPYHSPDFNTIYYNPAFTYLPAVNAPDPTTGVFTDMRKQDKASTSDWAKVQDDPFLNPSSLVDLANGYKSRVWCAANTDPATICFVNTAYQFPDDVHKFGDTTTIGNPKYRLGSPYYYRMQTAQYCKDTALTICESGSAIVPGTHIYMAPEYCSDPELTKCVAGAAVVSNVHIYSGPRWCRDKDVLVDCQRKKAGKFLLAKHLGMVKDLTGGPFPAVANTGFVNVTGVNTASGGTINDITIGNVSVITAKITFGPGSTAAGVAGLISAEIGKSADFATSASAVPSVPPCPATTGGVVTVCRRVAGVSGAGEVIAVSTNAVGTLSSKGRIRITVSNPLTTTGHQSVTTVSVNGVNLLCTPVAGDPMTFGSVAQGVTVLADGTIDAASGTNTTNRRNAVRDALFDRINRCKVGGFSAETDGTSGTTDLLLVAPVAAGSTPNDQSVSRAGGFAPLANFQVAPMGSVQPGVSTGDVVTSVIAMNGGQDASVAGTREVRVGVGAFSRIDIVSSVPKYTPPADAKRSDCISIKPDCSYEEEMTNFANWYAYYRTRMLMMKTSVGRAFGPVDGNFRVGFITICPLGFACPPIGDTKDKPLDLSKYLRVAEFAPAHKNAWYLKLYATKPAGLTPLREGLARVGQMYAGVLGSGLTVGLKSTGDPATTDDPMIRSCQRNFALLATDGYWDGGPGLTEKGDPIKNPDGADTAPYSLRSQGVFDGGDPASAGTLADVALYYYTTDLRIAGAMSPNNLKPTANDPAIHQHMVTFTLGLGLEGELTFRDDYRTATSGDFFDITTDKTKNWPVPVPDQPSALDDLWHAAVNGRGVFYSVKDPVKLAASLADMRDQIKPAAGAGAAAATSNLQPVAGDNFAFTASFETFTWKGDLKARTIDLNTGVVSEPTLWEAAKKLDARSYTDRQIFTFDAADVTVTGVTGDGSGNLLRHFCPTGTCTDGGGLTAVQMSAYFPTKPLSQVFTASQAANATNVSLVNFLRGDRSNESSSLTRPLPTDLYRTRSSMLGDIINAQPAYVKRSPFSYQDLGYSDFKNCTEGRGSSSTCPVSLFPDPSKTRPGTVFAAANDGMLHAFETDLPNPDDNGNERWAYIPGLVLPDLYQLANDPYIHTYLTDGTPQVGDVDFCKSPAASCSAGETRWRTILVAGLNSGGRGYYALDITNPLAPKGLWEFGHGPCRTDADITATPNTFNSDCQIGFTFGNPVITKLFGDSRWVVIVTSGYNNTFGTPPDQGDGRGYLYILDALTGKILHRLATPPTPPTIPPAPPPPAACVVPCGLAKINGFTDNGATNNTARAIYGGDLDGNLWRFTLDFVPVPPPPPAPPPAPVSPIILTATKIAQLKDDLLNPQPITVKPELTFVGDIASGSRLIVFGTGKFLEVSDKTPPFATQSIYALKDLDLNNIGPGPLFSSGVRVTGVTPFVFKDSPANPPQCPLAGDCRTVETTLPIVPPALAARIPNVAESGVLGWRIDLKEIGERVNIDPVLQLGTLVIGSNVPTTDTCSGGGFSFVNFLDVATGSFVKSTATSTMASVKISDSLLVGVAVIMLPGGALKTIATKADETRETLDTPVPPKEFVGKRVSWRELFVDQ